MKNKYYFSLILMAAAAIIAIYIRGFLGGFLCGFFVLGLLLVTIGKYQFKKAADRIDAAITTKKLTDAD